VYGTPQDVMQHTPRGETTALRQAAERGLAIVGFVALVGAGIWLAFYVSRFAPNAANQIGSAAAVLSSVLVPNTATLAVVPASTTAPFDEEQVTPLPHATTTNAPKPQPTPKPSTPTTPKPGPATSAVFPRATTTATTAPVLSGLPDLSVHILATGYLASTSTDSFIATTTIPSGTRPAIKFSIQNIGTNVTPVGWHFSAAIPTQSAYVFYSPAQQALLPGDRVEYTLGFDQASPGVNRSISIIADSDGRVSESAENNNSATTQVTILR
jgi:hypothetical protein